MTAPNDTYGAILIGVVTAGILYGATCVQTCYYILHYPKDRWYIKLLVAILFFLDTAHQVVITHSLYSYVIIKFGQEPGICIWSQVGEVFFNVFTVLIVQCFLTTRIWTLSNENMSVTGSALVFVLAEFLVAIIYAANVTRFTTDVQLITLKPLSLTVNALGAAGDTVIAGYLCFFLQKSRTGSRSTGSLINKLILFTVNTSLLTSLCALASFVSYNLWPNTWIYVAFYLSIGRLYCNSLLATLNARKLLRDGLQNDTLSLAFNQDHPSNNKPGTGIVNFLGDGVGH